MADIYQSLTRRIVGPYDADSLSAHYRMRRWHDFAATFPDIGHMSVLDLGGDARAWRSSPVRPAQVTLLNIHPQNIDEPWMEALVGDACDPPDNLPKTDLIYSNSVIEHVGGHWRRQRFIEVVRTADQYWVQTPNRYFPIEPHFMLPWIQHLPYRLQQTLISRWPLGNYGDVTSSDEALRHAMNIGLLSYAEMRGYFPDAEIRKEKFCGLTKSFIAVKRR